ncbi:uncharacterized protein LOC135490686 [Lineus longissimus]|uniref:uncharacterized protein LOC135490686 n=1 Tax=Lineus longissimus TaxID=88925 RepID=UPI002B4D090C
MAATALVRVIMFVLTYSGYVDEPQSGIRRADSVLKCGLTCTIAQECKAFSMIGHVCHLVFPSNKATWNCRRRKTGVKYPYWVIQKYQHSYGPSIRGQFPVWDCKWHYHLKLKCIVGIAALRHVVTSTFNVYVFSQENDKSTYTLKHNFFINDLVAIAGEYEDGVIGIRQDGGAWWQAHDLQAFAFSLDGRNRQQLLLPYNNFRSSRGPGNSTFRYLRFIVNSNIVVFALTYLLGFKKLVTSLKLFRIRNLGIALKLNFFKSLGEAKYSTGFLSTFPVSLSNPQFDSEGNIFEFTFKPFKITITERKYMYNTMRTIQLEENRLRTITFAWIFGTSIIGVTWQHTQCGDCFREAGEKHRIRKLYLFQEDSCRDKSSALAFPIIAKIRFIPTVVYLNEFSCFVDVKNRLILWPKQYKFRKGHTLKAKIYI